MEIYTVDENGFIVPEEVVNEESQADVLETEIVSETGESDDVLDLMEPSSAEEIVEESTDSIIPYMGDVSVFAVSDSDALASGDGSYSLDGMVIFNVEVSNYGSCQAVFTPELAEKVTIDNGKIVNWSSSDIRVPLYVGQVGDRDAADTLNLTILGRGSTNYAKNLYRYGSDQYVTSYYVDGSSLSSTITYVGIFNADQVSYSRSYWLEVVFAVCLIIMAVNGLIRFLRRGHRG